MLVIVNCQVIHLKRRDNMRLLRQFACKGIDSLVRERDSLGKSFEHTVVKYFDIAKEYCLIKAELEEFE